MRDDAPLAPILERLRLQGFGADEVAMLERSARELSRMDALFRRYVGPRLADRLREEPAFAQLGGEEKDVTVLFADLQGFTSFSEGRPAGEVIEMVNAYWEAAVPIVVEREGGLIERFAGDAIMAVFNALDDQPDHPLRAARAGLAMRDLTEEIAAEHPDLAALPDRREHRSRRDRQRGPTRSTELRGDRRHDERRCPPAVRRPRRPGARERDDDRAAGRRGGVRSVGMRSLKGKGEEVEVFELVGLGRSAAMGSLGG